MSSKFNGFTKDNVDMYFSELAKELKKEFGRKSRFELVVVGGAAVCGFFFYRKEAAPAAQKIITKQHVPDTQNETRKCTRWNAEAHFGARILQKMGAGWSVWKIRVPDKAHSGARKRPARGRPRDRNGPPALRVLQSHVWRAGTPGLYVEMKKAGKQEDMHMIIRTQDGTGTFVFENCEGITPNGDGALCILARNGRYVLGTYGSTERIKQIQYYIAESFANNEKIYQMPGK